MKRACFLLALVILVIWLAHGAPAGNSSTAPRDVSVPATAASSNAVPQQSCCVNQGDTDPHRECFDGACYQVSGCGQNVNCASCG